MSEFEGTDGKVHPAVLWQDERGYHVRMFSTAKERDASALAGLRQIVERKLREHPDRTPQVGDEDPLPVPVDAKYASGHVYITDPGGMVLMGIPGEPEE